MATLRLPPEVEAVFREFRTCEFTAVNRQGQPLTWPTEPYYDAPEGRLKRCSFPIPLEHRSPTLQLCWFREMPL